MKDDFRILPLTLREANRLVQELHRHHKPVRGHRFSLALLNKHKAMVGAVIVGRPVSRGCDPGATAEVTRLVTNGTPNACSALYGAAARVCKEMGFETIQTYILDTEPGTSLCAAGWTFETMTSGGQWKHTDGRARRTDQPNCKKQRWTKRLIAPRKEE